jgi:uncharacterized protein YmfQ (DUF2313 family)
MLHYNALKMLMPLELGDVDTADIMLEGGQLDQAMTAIPRLMPEAFPSTTEMLLARWEAEYGLLASPQANIADRRLSLRAKYVTIGSMSREYFITLARVLGYDISITEDADFYRPFRAGISRAGVDAVYSPSTLWVWTVTTHGRPAGRDIIDAISDLNPPHMRLHFTHAP